MRKIYTITFHFVLNYGAVLQAYALCKYLNKLGADCRLIDYRPKYFLYQTYRPNKNIFKTVFKIIKNIRFYNFRRKYLPLTKKIFITNKSLKRYFSKSEDIVICGSDQIWNKELTGGNLSYGYFLQFVPNKGKKIAYAASMGNTPFNLEDKSAIYQSLNTYHKLGIREDFVRDQINLISDNTLESKIVVDPTLLLSKEEYEPIISNNLVPNEDYIATYLTEDSDLAKDYIQKIKSLTGLKVINLGHHRLKNVEKNYLYLSPSKWLGLFANAKIVCTNSFHGTAYSLIFEKNFTVISRVTKKKLNRRQLTILENLKLEDRFIYSTSEINQDHLKEINYETLKPRYETLIKKSKQFLAEIVKDAT